MFNILSLYIIHTYFIKYFNSYYIIARNVFIYLICFFLFVRVDVLNSIHSFNSISISNNYKNLTGIFLLFFIFLTFNTIKIFFIKFKSNFKMNFVLLFFQLVNTTMKYFMALYMLKIN